MQNGYWRLRMAKKIDQLCTVERLIRWSDSTGHAASQTVAPHMGALSEINPTLVTAPALPIFPDG